MHDHFLSNGDDSGRLRYSHSTPVVGLLYQLTPRLNLYTSAARGFQTPPLNELFYSGTGGGFNFHLQASDSTRLEAGLKARPLDGVRVNAAVFQVRTSGDTLRQGAELALRPEHAPGADHAARRLPAGLRHGPAGQPAAGGAEREPVCGAGVEGHVIVGDTNKRYYEAAPGRNWMLGASASYEF